jgi:hypothetical protein
LLPTSRGRVEVTQPAAVSASLEYDAAMAKVNVLVCVWYEGTRASDVGTRESILKVGNVDVDNWG